MKDMHSNSRFSTEITPQPAAPIESSEQSDEHEHVLEKDDNEAPRRSMRQRVAKSLGDDFTVYLVDNPPTSIARLLENFAPTRPPSKSAVAAYRRLQRRLLRSLRRTIFVRSAPFVFPAAPAQYVFCDQI